MILLSALIESPLAALAMIVTGLALISLLIVLCHREERARYRTAIATIRARRDGGPGSGEAIQLPTFEVDTAPFRNCDPYPELTPCGRLVPTHAEHFCLSYEDEDAVPDWIKEGITKGTVRRMPPVRRARPRRIWEGP
jgi:hypothetical protein